MSKKNTFPLARYFSICFLLIVGSSLGVLAQTPEKKSDEVKSAEIGIKVESEDVEKARLKAEEIKAIVDKSMEENESLISDLQRDRDTTMVYLKRLQQDKKTYQTEGENPKFLQLLDKEIDIIKEKLNVSDEQIETYEDQITALQNQLKAYTDQVALLETIAKLEEIIAVTPFDQALVVKKELDIAKGYIATVHASLKERDTIVSFFTHELEDVKVRVSDREKDLIKDLELQKKDISDEELLKKIQEKIDSIIVWRKAIGAQWIVIFKTRLGTAKVRYDQIIQILKNAELNIAFLAEKANRLEEKLRSEELKKKQAELEAAKRAEEVNQKIAEMRRAEAEKALQEAIRKAEEVAQKQMVTTSPEKKRVLELEAELHKQTGLVARKKDELITEGEQRYKDATEYKELEADIEFFLERRMTASVIDEFLRKTESDIQRFSNAITVIESLITSVKREEKLFLDNLKNAQEEISKIEKEIAVFENKELARQIKEYAHQKIEIHEELTKLLSAILDRLHERLEIKNNALALSNRTREKLITMRAANIWARIESNISTETFKTIYKDLIQSRLLFDTFYNTAQNAVKNFILYLDTEKKTVSFWIRLCGLLVILAGLYFSKRFLCMWCTSKIEESYEATHAENGSDVLAAGDEITSKIEESYKVTDISYYKSRLLPSLLLIMKKSIGAFWIAILSFSLTSLFHIRVPWVTATVYILTYFAVYKILKSFLIESFGPEKGDKKLVTSLAYVSPTHLYRSLNIMLLFSLISLSAITVLTVFEYRNDVIKLLWFVYRLGMLILLLWLATQRTFILKLLPSGEGKLGKFIHRVIVIIYPIFITFVISLFAIRSLGYSVLTYALLKTCIKSFIVAFIVFLVWKYVQHRLNYIRDVRLKKKMIQKGTSEEKKFHAITSVYSVSCKYAISIIAAIIIIRVWVRTFYDALGSPAAPYLVQKIFGQIGAALGTLRSGLSYRFVFEDGKYTTPIKIIVAFAIFLVFFFIARYIKKLLEERVFYKLRLERGARQTFSSLIRYVIVGIAALIGLNLAGIPLKSLTIFAGAFGIGIGFGMQNIISNFVSGIILLFERPMRVGDVVILDDGTGGTIESINARSTTLTTPDGVTITVPNAKFIENRITNWTLPTPLMRGCVKVGVAYGSDTGLVKQCLLEIAKQNPNVKVYPEPVVRFAEFGENALRFELYFWADDPGKRWFTMSELNFAIDKVFKQNNIEIAFPQHDIHIRSIVPFPVPDKDKKEIVTADIENIVYKRNNA
ncbi:MAG: mechanosensitive ion channel [Candidatus Jettenia caeni]|nr:mechanosensitive ion channel [Candidatus Jettenia caeni]